MKKIIFILAFCVFCGNVWVGDKVLKITQYTLKECQEKYIKSENEQAYDEKYVEQLKKTNECLKKEIRNRAYNIFSMTRRAEFIRDLQPMYNEAEKYYEMVIQLIHYLFLMVHLSFFFLVEMFSFYLLNTDYSLLNPLAIPLSNKIIANKPNAAVTPYIIKTASF